MSQIAYVLSSFMINSLGEDTASVNAGLKANISGVIETQFISKSGSPLKMAMLDDQTLPPLNPILKTYSLPSIQTRLLRLASIPLNSIKQSVFYRPNIPIVCVLPELIVHLRQQWLGDPLEQLNAQTSFNFNKERSLFAEVGRAGGIHAIKHAINLVNNGEDLVIILGVDTYCDEILLKKLDAENRLLVADNGDGFIPAEGACALLLGSEKLASRISNKKIGLHLPGLAREPAHRYGEGNNTGLGLTQSFKAALEYATKPVTSVWTSYLHDHFSGRELGAALTRISPYLDEDVQINHPADMLGDLGAAAGPSIIGVLSHRLLGSKAKDEEHLISCSSDQEYRASVLIKVIS